MTTQLDLLDCYAAGVDPDTAAILDLIAGDPTHERDREAIVNAIRASVDAEGYTSGNHWRRLIPTWCYPRCVGATVHALARAGVLVADGWLVSDDTVGRNSGRPCRRYRWVGA